MNIELMKHVQELVKAAAAVLAIADPEGNADETQSAMKELEEAVAIDIFRGSI